MTDSIERDMSPMTTYMVVRENLCVRLCICACACERVRMGVYVLVCVRERRGKREGLWVWQQKL